MTGDLRIIENNVLRKIFIKNPEYIEVRPIYLKRIKCCILKGLDKCILNWCCKNGVDKSFFSVWINNTTNKIDEKITHLANNLYTYKHGDIIPNRSNNSLFLCAKIYCNRQIFDFIRASGI